ncbi:unnamed protein product [Musa acuminata subsp. burmannicoides]
MSRSSEACEASAINVHRKLSSDRHMEQRFSFFHEHIQTSLSFQIYTIKNELAGMATEVSIKNHLPGYHHFMSSSEEDATRSCSGHNHDKVCNALEQWRK